MLIDIIGSRAMRHVTEFKNFPYKINNFILDQSLLTLKSEPIRTSMKDINTTDLTNITIAHRDLNKGQWEKLEKSTSDILIIDLLGELRSVSKIGDSFYNSDSLGFIQKNEDLRLTRVEQFRLLEKFIDENLVDIINRYEKVLLVKLYTSREEEADFIAGIYEMFEDKIKNKLLLEYTVDPKINVFHAPLEFYHNINMDLKKFESDGYETQLLFNEQLVNNELTIFMNYIDDRQYVYELFKNGKPFKKSKPTTSRFFKFRLDESAKYRIRVNLVDGSIKPRLSKTFEFKKDSVHTSKSINYIEMPEEANLWLLNIALDTTDGVKGVVGNLFKYSKGYEGYSVYDYSEVDDDYLPASRLLSYALDKISTMDHIAFTKFLQTHREMDNKLLQEFIQFITTKR